VFSFSQDTEIKNLQFLVNDLSNNFQESIGDGILLPDGDSSNLSKVTLPNTSHNYIKISNKDNSFSWAIFTANISDSCSLTEASKLANYWRSIVGSAVPNYSEKSKNKKLKTYSGDPILGYDYELEHGNYMYWININYSKRPRGKGYIVMILIGRQLR
jgi:hypothetical protein